jgi:hypothetical protein
VRLEQLGRMVAHELEGVAPFDEGDALGDQAFELDGLDLGAVLCALGAALGRLVVVEVALDPGDRAMEEVDEGPEEAGEIVLETGFAEHLSEDVEDVVQGRLAGLGVREEPVIGLVLVWSVAVEGQLVEQVGGGRLCRAGEVGFLPQAVVERAVLLVHRESVEAVVGRHV